MHSFLQDVRHGLRLLRRSPGFVSAALLTLALGIGAVGTVFTLIDAVLFRPLPGIGDSDRVVSVGRSYKGDGFDNSSYPNFRDLRDQNTMFSDVAAEHTQPISVSDGARADRVQGAIVTPNYFRTLGVRMSRGRGFLDNEDIGSAAPATVVISYGLWRNRFGGDSSIVGKRVLVNGMPMTIVGVSGRGFIGTSATSVVDVWVPMSAARQVLPSFLDLDESLRHRTWVWIMIYARLKPGVTFEQANAEVTTIAARLRKDYPELEKEAFGWTLAPGVGLTPAERSDLSRLTGILLSVAALLLLLACANISNLLLARATARSREMSVRLALGAARARLIRQLLTENLLVSMFGGLAGFALSTWAAAALSRFFAASDRFSLAVDLTPEWRGLAFTFAVATASGVIFGIAPALRSSNAGLVPGLKQAAALAPRRSRLRPLLVVIQLSFSLILVSAAGLLLRTLWNFNQVRPGFDTRDLQLFTVQPNLSRKYSDADLRLFYQRLFEQVRALSGVEGATLARVAPVSRSGWGVNSRFPDKPNDPNNGLSFNTVAPNYFEMMGVPVVRGRGFTFQDTASSAPVLVVNETLAKSVWPGEDAIGKQVFIADEKVPRQVIGIVSDLKYRSLLEKSRPFAYMSMWQPYPMPDSATVIHIRTRQPLAQMAAQVQRVVLSLDPNLPIFDVKAISDQIADSYWRQRVTGMLVGIIAALALALAMAGMSGVMAYVVAERTREIGIRMALGANATEVVSAMVRNSAVMIVAGITFGTAGALAATRLLQSYLYGVGARDPLTLGAAASLLGFAALVASYVPARRAARVDPMVALRQE